MSKIKNEANLHEREVDINRAAIEHRATWMGLIFDELQKAGVANAEEICRKAIKRCGNMHGDGYRAACGASTDCRTFREQFLPPLSQKTFEMDVAATENDVDITFRYCPLVSAWQKLGFDDETCALLCDIAMDGDRGIAQSNSLRFELGDTIGQGNDVCRLRLSR